MNAKLLLSTCLLFILFSCDTEPVDTADTAETPEEEVEESEESLRLKKRITDYGDEVVTEIFSYDGNRLTAIEGPEGAKYEYRYENEVLKAINYTVDEEVEYELTLSYDASNRIDSYIVLAENDEGFRFELSYNDDGSISQKEFHGDHNAQNSLSQEIILTLENDQVTKITGDNFSATHAYDEQKGIYSSIDQIATLNSIDGDFSGYIDGGKNNLLKVTENDNGSASVFEEYTYTYNAAGYPESANYYNYGELDSTIQYVYE